jgi:hypothetical protein
MARIDFDSSQVPDRPSQSLLPAGDYQAILRNSELRDTRAMDGQYWEFVFQVIDGPRKGATITDRLNWMNRNETAVQIGRWKMAQICKAVGKPAIQDTRELENLPLIISVVQRKQRDSDRVNNEVTGYKPSPGQYPPAAPGANQTLRMGNFPQFGPNSRS